MGILQGLFGNASEVDQESVSKQIESALVDGEIIEHAYKLVRDLIVFTNLRLILIDKQGFTGKKRQLHSIPYASITQFSMENRGRFDMDAEIKVWIRGEPGPRELSFGRDDYIDDAYRVLSRAILR